MYLSEFLDKSKKNTSFHMPGHKEKYKIFERDYIKYDKTEYGDLDNLQKPEGIIASSIKRIERVYGSKKSFILVNGSTCGILASMFYALHEGDKIIIPRGCHKSVYNGLLITKTCPLFLYNENKFSRTYDLQLIEKYFKKGAKGIVVTSPTYEGIVMNVKEVSEVAKKYNGFIIVDEAHGAHFALHREFPSSSVKYGDFIINSTHKTLPTFTQTALLHIGEKIDGEKMQTIVNIFQSTSPSYMLMYSIDKFFHNYENNIFDFDNYISVLKRFRNKCNSLKNIFLLESELSRFTFYSYKISGFNMNKYLYENKIETEMYLDNYIVCISTICDTEDDLNKLFYTMEKLDKSINSAPIVEANGYKNIIPKGNFNCNYLRTKGKYIKLNEAEGCIAKDFIIPYPPGIPILVPGEIISSEIIKTLLCYIENKEVLGITKNNEILVYDEK
ncbi:MAG: aminotransferase class I/II-fold pyridoxal phosphate-dependent enzyme [Lachnospirales bacterium]